MSPGAGPSARQAPLGARSLGTTLALQSICALFVLETSDYPATMRNGLPASPWSLPASTSRSLRPLQAAAPSGLPEGLPVAFPGVPHICVVDAVSVCLLIQEVKHVLDGQGESAAPVHRAEQGLEQVIHELLQGALGEGWGGAREGEGGGRWGAGSRRADQIVPWTDPALEIRLRRQAVQTVRWGWGGGRGVSGRWEGLKRLQIPRKNLSSNPQPHATSLLVSVPGGNGHVVLGRKTECSESRLPAGTGGRGLGREGV